MKKVLIGVMLGLFLSGIGIASVQAEEKHTRQYEEWREKTTQSLQLNLRCLEVKKGIKLLANNVKNKYGNSPESLESISNYIKWIHIAFIVLARDKGLSQTKTLDIPGTSALPNDPACWFTGELLKAMKPLDDLAYIADKTPKEVDIISSAKLDNIRFIHIIVEELKNGGNFREAIDTVDVFEGKPETNK